jgi:hypothetical protein
MSRVAIASIFRNSESYIHRYFEQLAMLTGSLTGAGFDIHLILVEGDSIDNTWNMLQDRARFLFKWFESIGRSQNSKLSLFQASHGGPVFGSVDNEQRWRNISYVCNKVLESVEEADDYLLYVESDLIWDADTMQYLLGDLDNHGLADAVAPMSIHRTTGLFYDIWGYRKDGVAFTPHPPFHPGVGIRFTPIDSAGSCIAMRGEVARACRFTPPERGIVGFGGDIRAKGFTLYLDPQLRVYHP